MSVPLLPTATERARTRRPLHVRLFVGAVAGALALFALYLVGANLFLSSRLFTAVVDSSPETVDIHFRRAWSWFPGRVHARGVSIRSRDSHIDFILTVDAVDFDISLVALARKRFELSHVNGAGISLRVRPRLATAPTSIADYADLPPIAGLGDYAVSTGIVSPDTWDDSQWHLWTIDLEEVSAVDVREVWIGPTRFVGSLNVDGRFFLKPIRRANVGPCAVSIDHGVVAVGARAIVTEIAGAVDLTMADFDARYAPGLEILRFLTLTSELRAGLDLQVEAPDVGAVAAKVALPRVALRVAAGVLARGTVVEASVRGGLLRRRDTLVRGDLGAELAVVDDAGRARMTFSIDASRLEAHRADLATPPFARLDAASISGDAASLDLRRLFDDLHARIDVPSVDVGNARALEGVLPASAGIVVRSGVVRARGALELWLATRTMSGSARLDGAAIDVTAHDARVRGAASVTVAFGAYAWDAERFTDASIVVALDAVSVGLESDPAVTIVRAKELRVTAKAAVFELANPLAGIELLIAMPEALVIDSGTVRAYLARGSVSRIKAGDAPFAVTGAGTITGAVGQSTFDLTSPRLAFVYRGLSVSGDAHARLRAHDLRLHRGDLALDEASLDLTHVAISPVGGVDGAAPAIRVESIALRATSPRLTLSDPLAQLDVTLSLTAGRVDDSAALNRLLPSKSLLGLESDGARFSASGHAKLGPGGATGDLTLRARDVGVGGTQVHARGDVSLVVDGLRWSRAAHTLDVGGAALLVTGVTGRFHGAAPQFSVRRVLVIGAATAVDPAHPSSSGIDARVAVDDAILPDVKDAASLLPSDSVLGLESGRLEASLTLVLAASTKTTTGALDVHLRDGGVRFHTAHYEGDFALAGALGSFDPARRSVEFSGSKLTMRDVLVTHTALATSRWHGDLFFERGTLRVGDAFLVDTYVALDARDADPLLSVALGDDLPDILSGLVAMPHLKGTAHLRIGSGRFALSDIDATGGDLKLRGIYAARTGHVRGAFAIDKGPVSAGVRIDDRGTHLQLFHLDRWLVDQTSRASDWFDDAPATAPAVEASPSAALP